MGQLTAQNSALIDPNSGSTFVGSPNQVLAQTNQILKNQPVTMNNGVPNQNVGDLPRIGTPSFVQAATAGEQAPGAGNAMSPGLNKAGKLVTLLTSGLRGALAGQAASEQATIQSGGRRSGGAGIGFEAGLASPYATAMPAQELAQKQAQTELLRQQANMVPTPYGPMPAALARYILPAQIRGEAEQGAAQTKAGATIGAANIGATSRQNVAQINRKFMAVPGVGLYDTQRGLVIPGTQAGITVTPDIAQEYNLPQEFIGKPMNLSQLSALENGQRNAETVVEGANGPALVNKQFGNPNFGQVTTLGLGNPSMGRGVQVADPNNPGNTVYTTMGNAIQTGAQGTQSASVQVPRQAAKAEVPTKIGDQKVAFTTMIQHAELLRDAARALANGDVQTLSGLKNAFKNEFGYSGPITAQAIADAYGGEVTNVISKGHITDKEMAKTGKTIDLSKQNFATVDSVLGAYQALAQSKMNMLKQQEQNAVNRSQPNRSGATNPPGGTSQGQSSGGFKPF